MVFIVSVGGTKLPDDGSFVVCDTPLGKYGFSYSLNVNQGIVTITTDPPYPEKQLERNKYRVSVTYETDFLVREVNDGN